MLILDSRDKLKLDISNLLDLPSSSDQIQDAWIKPKILNFQVLSNIKNIVVWYGGSALVA